MMPHDDNGQGDFVPIAESLPKIKPLTPVRSRRMKASIDIHDTPAERIAYQHTVLCQTCLPYRDPGEARIWDRRQGAVFLASRLV